MRFILNWLVYAIAIAISAYLLPGVTVEGLVTVLILAVVLGAINAILRPIFIVLTLPVTVLTLGLFILVINALLVLLAAAIVPGFSVASFWWAFVFAIVLAVISGFLNSLRTEE